MGHSTRTPIKGVQYFFYKTIYLANNNITGPPEHALTSLEHYTLLPYINRAKSLPITYQPIRTSSWNNSIYSSKPNPMPTFVYITKQCCQDAQQQGFSDLVVQQAQRIRQHQMPVGLRHFRSDFFRKRIAHHGRLVVKRKYLAGHTIYIFTRLFTRGDNRYEQFLNDVRLGNCEAYDNLLPSDEQLKDWLKKETAEQPTAPLIEMTEIERQLLYDALNPRIDDELGMIAESIRWINTMSSPQMKERRLFARRVVEEIVTEPPPEDSQTRTKSQEGLTIFYAYYPEWKYWYLYDIHINGQTANTDDRTQVYPQTKEELLQASGRIFPVYFVLEENIWLDIQDSREANLALSP